jgi:hypothetical protein
VKPPAFHMSVRTSNIYDNDYVFDAKTFMSDQNAAMICGSPYNNKQPC